MKPLPIDATVPSEILLYSSNRPNPWFTADSRFVIAVVILFGIGMACAIRFGHEVFDPIAESLTIQGWAALVARPSLLWFSMGMLLLVIRTILWVRYHPFAIAEYEHAPRLSVVIPAYNEGAMVQKAVESCAQARYPHDRLEIIVIDDGSTTIPGRM